MIPLALADVAAATGGRLVDGADPAAVVAAPVVIDSRRCEPGGLFVCVVGEHLDGHAFAQAAVAAGAVAVIAARPVGVPAVLVDDPQRALGRLATAVLGRVPECRVLGVTGSSGKTSTKDLLARVLARGGATVAPEGSLNNELGLPLTVLRIGSGTRHLVLEYSARGVGHIRYLCGIARPQVAIVLNVGAAHLGEFGSREAIAAAKGELVEALPVDGVAVLNADDALVSAMAQRTSARVVTFGVTSAADVTVHDLSFDAQARPRFRLRTPEGDAQVRMQLSGAHHASNAAAVAAAALVSGGSLDDVVAGLESAGRLSPHRMALAERADGALVIDDAYNANPDSMHAALRALAEIGGGRRRCWAVLGVMQELGETSAALHEEVGRFAAGVGVDELVAVGAAAAAIAEGATATPGWSGRARRLPDVAAAATLLRTEVSAGDVVLVKASNSERMWRLAELLTGAELSEPVA